MMQRDRSGCGDGMCWAVPLGEALAETQDQLRAARAERDEALGRIAELPYESEMELQGEIANLRVALEHVIEACEHSSPTIHAYDYIAHSARRALGSLAPDDAQEPAS